MIMRKDYLDYAKGIGAMLVIFGHMTTYPRVIRSAIYSFHMPLFFVITGILFFYNPVNTDFKNFTKAKFNRIIIPGIFFELLMWLWIVVKNTLEYELTNIQLMKRFLGIFLQIGYSDFSGSLWFFFTYFIAVLLLYFILKIHRRYYLPIAVGLIGISYILAYSYPQMYLPWHLEIVPACMGYVLSGNLMAQMMIKIFNSEKCTKLLGGGAALVWIICTYIWGFNYALDSHSFGNVIEDTVVALSGSMSVVVWCKILEDMRVKCKPLRRYLSFAGKNSMEFYGIQAVMVGIMNTVIRHFISEEILYSWIGIVVSVFSLSVSLLIDTVIILEYKKYIVPVLRKINL